MPKVSVVIPTYNTEKFICAAIESVLKQTFKDYEIIVIDDGSTDNTAILVKKYGKQIKYIHQKNSGVAIARNVAIENSLGEYIALLDADDLFFPERLERCVDVLNSEEEVGIVHSDALRISETGTVLGHFEREIKYLNGYISKELVLRKSFLISSTTLFRKSCLLKTGMFDPNLSRLGVEDRDLWIRIAKYFKIKYIPETLIYYRNTNESMSKDCTKMIKGSLYVVDKYYPPHHGIVNLMRRRVLSVTYRTMADWYFLETDKIEALKYYIKSLSILPCDIITLSRLAKLIIKLFINRPRK